MAATKPYADYAYYTGDFGGTLLTESTFTSAARWASYYIDSLTGGRLTSDDMIIDCIRDATCAAAELYYNYKASSVNVEGGSSVQSESNDGYSISYGDTLSTAESLQSECRALISVYLSGTGLLSRKVPNPKRRRWPW